MSNDESNDDQKITKIQSCWNLITDGFKYRYNLIIFDSLLGSQDIEVVDGRAIEKIVS